MGDPFCAICGYCWPCSCMRSLHAYSTGKSGTISLYPKGGEKRIAAIEQRLEEISQLLEYIMERLGPEPWIELEEGFDSNVEWRYAGDIEDLD